MGWGNCKPPFGTTLDPSHPSLRSLRWALPFNEGRGTTLYNQLRHVTTTLSYPTLGAGAAWMAHGLTFDAGTTAFVDCGAQNDLNVAFTVIMRAKTNSVTGLHTLFGQNSVSGSEAMAGSLYLDGANLSYWHNDSAETLDGTATLVTNRWYTYALVRAGVAGAWTLTSYIDGNQDDTAATANNPRTNSPGNLRVGFAGAYTGAPWDGLIDWFFLWTRALDLVEIQQISARPFDLYYKAPEPFFVPEEEGEPGGFVAYPRPRGMTAGMMPMSGGLC